MPSKPNDPWGFTLPPPSFPLALVEGDPHFLQSNAVLRIARHVSHPRMPDSKTLAKISRGGAVRNSTIDRMVDALGVSEEELVIAESFTGHPNAAYWTVWVRQIPEGYFPSLVTEVKWLLESEVGLIRETQSFARRLENWVGISDRLAYLSEDGKAALNQLIDLVLKTEGGINSEKAKAYSLNPPNMVGNFEILLSSCMRFALRYERDINSRLEPEEAICEPPLGYLELYFSQPTSSSRKLGVLFDFWRSGISRLRGSELTWVQVATSLRGRKGSEVIDIEDRKRRLRAWREGRDMPSDEILEYFIGNFAENLPLSDICNVANNWFRFAKLFIVLQSLESDLAKVGLPKRLLKEAYSRQLEAFR